MLRSLGSVHDACDRRGVTTKAERKEYKRRSESMSAVSQAAGDTKQHILFEGARSPIDMRQWGERTPQ